MSMQCVLPLVRASKILNKFCTEDFTFFNFHYTHKLCTGPDCVATSKTHLIGIRTFFGTDQVHYKKIVFCLNILANYGEGNGTPLQYSCLANPMDRGAW